MYNNHEEKLINHFITSTKSYNYIINNKKNFIQGMSGYPVYHGYLLDNTPVFIKEMHKTELYKLLYAQDNKHVVQVIAIKNKNNMLRYPVIMEELTLFNFYQEDQDNNTNSCHVILDNTKINIILKLLHNKQIYHGDIKQHNLGYDDNNYFYTKLNIF